MDLELIKRISVGASYKSADLLHKYLGNISQISKKGAIDIVTEADIESEKVIIETIREKFPNHTILAEESGLAEGSGLSKEGAECKWIIDPLDGTTNFAHQLGLFSVSIAFMMDDDIKVGVVLNPETGELFTAIKGQGAMLNGHPIKVSDSKRVAQSLLVTGFPYNFKEILDPLITRFKNCLEASMGVRRLGSAALDLCFVACGRFDGFWEQNLKPWDTAAGLLIAKEAGAKVTDFSSKPFFVDKKELLATNGSIHNEMISLLEINQTI